MIKTLCVDLQIRDYKETLDLQHRLVDLRARGFTPNVLLLVEHPHVITMGKSAKPQNILAREYPIYEIERGGDVTYHGYGQLVGYPILDLSSLNKDIRGYLRKLERILIETLAGFGISAQRVQGRTGVWVDQRKIASIGVAVRSWITFHGFALNVSTDLSRFDAVNPCGYESRIMTSMSKELGKPISIREVKGPLTDVFARIFDTELEHTDIEALLL